MENKTVSDQQKILALLQDIGLRNTLLGLIEVLNVNQEEWMQSVIGHLRTTLETYEGRYPDDPEINPEEP